MLAILAPTTHEVPTEGLEPYDMIGGVKGVADWVGVVEVKWGCIKKMAKEN